MDEITVFSCLVLIMLGICLLGFLVFITYGCLFIRDVYISFKISHTYDDSVEKEDF